MPLSPNPCNFLRMSQVSTLDFDQFLDMSESAPFLQALTLGVQRYPKRKRALISYDETENGQAFEMQPTSSLGTEYKPGDRNDEKEWEWSPIKKIKRSSKPGKKVRGQDAKDEKPFPFLSLPAELRNTIYEMALVDPSQQVWLRCQTAKPAATCFQTFCYHTKVTRSSHWGHSKYALSSSLLATCKTIHDEAVPFLYSQPMCVPSSNVLLTFLANIGPQNTILLRDITITGWYLASGPKQACVHLPAFALLRGATNLRKLTISATVEQLRCVSDWRRKWASGDPRMDDRRARCVARRLYLDCFPWLESMVWERGAEVIADVLEIQAEGNFSPDAWMVRCYGRGGSVEEWTPERFEKVEEMMHMHLKKILKRRGRM